MVKPAVNDHHQNVSLGFEKKSFGSLPALQSGYATIFYCVLFAHLLTLEYPDHHHNLISSSLYYPGPLHTKSSSQPVHNFLSNVVHRQTDRQTSRQTIATKKHNLLCQGGN